MRCLEIGPGRHVIPGFETFNLSASERTDGGTADHEGDARRLPFADATFDVVYSSHCIEHVHWYQIQDTLAEWARVVKPGGTLEVCTVDAYKLMKVLVQLEETGAWTGPDLREWKNKHIREKIKGDPYLYCNGRLLSYPRTGDYDSNLHRALITPKLLHRFFCEIGLHQVRHMHDHEVRGKHHGWINMGVIGTK